MSITERVLCDVVVIIGMIACAAAEVSDGISYKLHLDDVLSSAL